MIIASKSSFAISNFSLEIQPLPESSIDLEVLYPINFSDIQITQNKFFNITVNITCRNADCGNINVSLDPSPVTIKLDSNNDLADVYVFEPMNEDSRVHMKWNISAIPDSQTVEDAKLCMYINSVSGSPDNDAKISRFRDEDWLESNPPLDPTQINITTDKTWSSISASTWSCVNVTLQVQESYNEGENNLSLILDDPDNTWEQSIDTYTDNSQLNFGSAMMNNQLIFEDRENSGSSGKLPYLNITYSGGGGGGGSSKAGLISDTIGDTPFYTNESNPRTISLNKDESQVVVFWVNATGDIDSTHEFFVYANLTSDMSISNISSEWNVTIVDFAPVVSLVAPENKDNSVELSGEILLNCSASDDIEFVQDVIHKSSGLGSSILGNF